jgi:hypothetical protein
MHVREALDRLDQIHDQLARAEVYRGFRVPAVAAVGVLGLLAAAVQPLVPDTAAGLGFVWYWVAVAGAGGLIGTAAALHGYVYREDEFDRRRTRRVMAQFLPCLLAGGAVTAGLARAPELVSFLPGLWAVLFGLGVVAARPHLPPAIGLVGLGYVVAGAALLLRAVPGAEPSGWAVGGVFGAGHLATALVLWHGVRRDGEGETDE